MLRFWVGEIGIDGLRIDAVPYLYENPEFLDEPKSNKTEDPDSYDFLDHIYTFNLPEVYDMIKGEFFSKVRLSLVISTTFEFSRQKVGTNLLKCSAI